MEHYRSVDYEYPIIDWYNQIRIQFYLKMKTGGNAEGRSRNFQPLHDRTNLTVHDEGRQPGQPPSFSNSSNANVSNSGSFNTSSSFIDNTTPGSNGGM